MIKLVTDEQFEELINRIFTKGYVVNECESEEKINCGRAGFLYDDSYSPGRSMNVLLKVWLTEDEILAITCFWDVFTTELSEIQKRLDNIVSEVMPDMKLIPQTEASEASKKGGSYHEFVYRIPLRIRIKKEGMK